MNDFEVIMMTNSKSESGGRSDGGSLLQALREPLLVLDSGLRVKMAIRSFYDTFKVTPEQTLGRFVYELGDGQWKIPALTKLLDELSPSNGEFDSYRVESDFPDIGRRTMLLNARCSQGDDEEPGQILLTIEDITERCLVELQAAERQRTWFQTALGSIGDAVIATDREACITFMNAAAETITGWTREQATGKPLHEVFKIVNEESRLTVENMVDKVLRLGAMDSLASHTVLIARDGTEHSIDDSASPIRDAWNGNIIGVVKVFHDISERRAIEQRLEISEIRYRRLFEAAHDGILIIDSKTRQITEVNPFMLQLLDYPREHFVGKELWEIGIFHDKDANQAAVQRLHENGSIRIDNLPLEDRHGHQHPVEIVANLYQEGQTPVIQCNIRDIGERVGFERERETMLANEKASRLEAEDANRSKDIFLATLSHEVRTPLNAILGWASILRGAKCDDADLAEGMEVIERNCKVQAQLIEDVLDISRIVSGKMRLQMRHCGLVDVIQSAIDVVRPTAEAKNIRIDAKLDPAANLSSCDANRMQQVIWNLLTNAIKFSPQGKPVAITLTRDGAIAKITVADSGQGMTPDFLPYVFDRFRQADSSTLRKFGGLGLGLSIVKHIVEMHGGTVQAKSGGKGRGSTFTVNLPIRAVRFDEGDGETSNETTDPSATDKTSFRLQGLSMLVVDDEADARRLLAKVLGEAGGTVTAVSSVDDALGALATTHPQVLVSDIAMPEKDGYDLIREIRAQGHSAKELPAVALTAFAHKDDRLRVMRAGFQVHVAKPVDPHELISIIAILAGRTD
jgi:PAS domain S-box-containing protein